MCAKIILVLKHVIKRSVKQATDSQKVYVLTPGVSLSLSRGYIHVYDHYFPTSSLKPHDQLKPNSIWSLTKDCRNGQSQIACGASLGRRNESMYNLSGSHDQDGRHVHLW